MASYSIPVLFAGMIYDVMYSINPNLFSSYDTKTKNIIVEIKNEYYSASVGKLDVCQYDTKCLESKGFNLNSYDTCKEFTSRMGPQLTFGFDTDTLKVKSGSEAYSKFISSCKECNMITYVEFIDQYGIKRVKKLRW